jgi:ABC-2 type transport system ATP-binding protein/lipopolysaccharide transport system ATP-binding protein
MNSRTEFDLPPFLLADSAIELYDVSVRYRVPSQRVRSFKEYAIRRLRRTVQLKEFWAIRAVNLSVRRGEVLAIIGPNGAGKSTLLKLIARVLRPTRGRVWVQGRVAPLLELGAGVDPELTGRENVFLNGALLGYTHRDLAERFDRIVDYAGIREFIDAPLRTYSSGMTARLGFAVATDVPPDILILDEVLAVGDIDFRKKSAERIRSFSDAGTTILLVTHSLDTVPTMCDRAMWLEHGEVQALGDARDIVREYQQRAPNRV